MVEREVIRKVRISRSLLLTLVLGALSLGIFIGSGMSTLVAPLHADKSDEFSGDSEGNFKYIRTSIEKQDGTRRKPVGELKPFRYKVKSLIAEKIKKGDVETVSVYFRDLNNGNWMGIGERETFSEKSLLKVPLMIAYFKWAESNPLVLRRTLTYRETPAGNTDDPNPGTTTSRRLEPGKHYSVNDLIFRMIAYDDVGAYALLRENMPAPRLDRIFKDLNVEYDPQKSEDSLSLRAFASFYRVLFNASYLSEEMSEKALRFLSKSSYRSGMASAVPSNIEIASKFGERSIVVKEGGDARELHQLHEYGIIYHPRRPFLLAVMARGADADRLTRTIRDITSLIYEEVDTQS